MKLTLKSDTKKGMVGFLIKNKVVSTKLGAEYLLVLFCAFCMSVSYLLISDTNLVSKDNLSNSVTNILHEEI